jgi:anthranilate 1,2-dioxygenase small subunit
VTLINLFATGKYLDEVGLDTGAAKFAERIVVLDSRNVDILMAVPL